MIESIERIKKHFEMQYVPLCCGSMGQMLEGIKKSTQSAPGPIIAIGRYACTRSPCSAACSAVDSRADGTDARRLAASELEGSDADTESVLIAESERNKPAMRLANAPTFVEKNPTVPATAMSASSAPTAHGVTYERTRHQKHIHMSCASSLGRSQKSKGQRHGQKGRGE